MTLTLLQINVNITLWWLCILTSLNQSEKKQVSGEGGKRDWEEKGILKTVSSGSLTSCEQSEEPPYCPLSSLVTRHEHLK